MYSRRNAGLLANAGPQILIVELYHAPGFALTTECHPDNEHRMNHNRDRDDARAMFIGKEH